MMKKLLLMALSLLVLAALMAPIIAQTANCRNVTTYYVADYGSDDNDGTTKDTAFKSVQKAIDVIGGNGGCINELDADKETVALTYRQPNSGALGVPVPTPVLYVVLAVAVVLLLAGGWWLRQKGNQLQQSSS
ncbi:MAG: hypothetical protein R3A44_06770 [Caldilineaceae bacterium]